MGIKYRGLITAGTSLEKWSLSTMGNGCDSNEMQRLHDVRIESKAGVQ